MGTIANKRTVLETAQALVKASNPDESHIEAHLKALGAMLSDVYGEAVEVVAVSVKEPS